MKQQETIRSFQKNGQDVVTWTVIQSPGKPSRRFSINAARTLQFPDKTPQDLADDEGSYRVFSLPEEEAGNLLRTLKALNDLDLI